MTLWANLAQFSGTGNLKEPIQHVECCGSLAAQSCKDFTLVQADPLKEVIFSSAAQPTGSAVNPRQFLQEDGE
jgi:hypothetical protein